MPVYWLSEHGWTPEPERCETVRVGRPKRDRKKIAARRRAARRSKA